MFEQPFLSNARDSFSDKRSLIEKLASRRKRRIIGFDQCSSNGFHHFYCLEIQGFVCRCKVCQLFFGWDENPELRIECVNHISRLEMSATYFSNPFLRIRDIEEIPNFTSIGNGKRLDRNTIDRLASRNDANGTQASTCWLESDDVIERRRHTT